MVYSILASYGLFLILVKSDGPFGSLLWLRGRFTALTCVICTSVYTSALISFLTTHNLSEWLVSTLALTATNYLIDWIVDVQ